MILHDIEPTDDVAVVSLHRVVDRMNIKHYQSVYQMLNRTHKYVCYSLPVENRDPVIERDYKDLRYTELRWSDPLANHNNTVNPQLTQKSTQRLYMPLDTAWRLIKDAEAGLILKGCERVL